ncbi:molybdenum cofactor biosynthesis protein MoaE [Gluconacetobacter tumulisoli]|uniref:Molybdopterin synthase catalytic subunit n=1 Tax=Gluconacetobacter tumulisoli TaxID=1286189 RepID=A0A7W4K8A8_9PROT|nr:molybdenum cofactor biosynthesis protein MoaE [Gluconacetobacter tumulisoli]MBB2202219.1 molybdenum cofactor biosynthesis protein MoaE [Gluconacetobacter tumulisoli]
MNRFLIADAPVDIAALREALLKPEAGGFCTFEGWVRQTNEGRAVSGIQYQAFAPLASSEGQTILDEALARFEITATRAMHRTGYLPVGDIAVWIGVAAPHRDAAFRACRYIIDEIKTRVPVWKREHYVGGCAEWVACHHVG